MAVSDTKQTVRATAVLTGSLVASDWVQTSNSGKVTFYFDWTQGDETSLDVSLQMAPDTTAGYTDHTESAASGVVTCKPASFTFAKADWTGKKPHLATSVGVSCARVLVKATGGTPTGTLAIYAEEATAL